MKRAVQLAALVVCACGAHAARPAQTPSPAPVALASDVERGADLFSTRGCVACHSIGAGLRVGPDLAGLAERREPDWIVAMITRPDSMLRHDPIARDLASEYRTAMPKLGIGPEEAGALLAYIRAGETIAPEDPSGSRSCPCPGCVHRRPAGRGARSGR